MLLVSWRQVLRHKQRVGQGELLRRGGDAEQPLQVVVAQLLELVFNFSLLLGDLAQLVAHAGVETYEL